MCVRVRERAWMFIRVSPTTGHPIRFPHLLTGRRYSPPRLSHAASPFQSPQTSETGSPEKVASLASSPRDSAGQVPEFTEEHARLLAMHEAQLRREGVILREALMGLAPHPGFPEDQKQPSAAALQDTAAEGSSAAGLAAHQEIGRGLEEGGL